MAREMLINNLETQECRIAVVDGGQLQELYVERASNASRVGNVYKGKITNIEPGIQAAFVDFGIGKNGFLHISDVHPMYFPKGKTSDSEAVGRKQSQRHRPPIQQCFKRGQEVIVQMTKEGIGTKGATLTTYLSIPGRLLVMMPGMSKLGVSRKIEDEDTRTKAREMLGQLTLPDNMGFIVRTAGLGSTKRDLQRDLDYLLRLWKTIQARGDKVSAPAEIYQESDLVIRTLRDIYNRDIKRVICDSPADARKVLEFVSVIMPRGSHKVEVSMESEGLFRVTGLDEEIEKIHARKVKLPSGGSLVIDQTEALVAIDVNSGRMRQHSDSETTAFKTNMEAAAEIARQLRLRDMGGMVVIDFIDLYQEKHRNELEKSLREAVKDDRAKTKILKMSQFGIVQMTRQRLRPSLKQSIYRVCEHCEGSGLIKSEESQTIDVMRVLQTLCVNENIKMIDLRVPPEVAGYLGNAGRGYLYDLEQATGRTIVVHADGALLTGQMEIVCRNARGSQVPWQKGKTKQGKKSKIETVDVRKLTNEPIEDAEDAATAAEDSERPVSGDLTTIEGEVLAENATDEAKPKRKRRRRRKKKATPEGADGTGETPDGEASSESAPAEEIPAEAPEQTETPETPSETPDGEASDDAPKPKRKRRRRKKTTTSADAEAPDAKASEEASETPADESASKETPAESIEGEAASEDAPKPKRKRRRRKKATTSETAEGASDAAPETSKDGPPAEAAGSEESTDAEPTAVKKAAKKTAKKATKKTVKKTTKKAAKKATRKTTTKSAAKADASEPSTESSDSGKPLSIVGEDGHIQGAAEELNSDWPFAK